MLERAAPAQADDADEVAEARAVLRDVFGHAAFRGGQGAAVDAVLAGGDAVVLLPTGGGKSLCYQVPAVVGHRRGRGTTIVISPLIALMADQVAALAGRGIAAAALHSQQDEVEQRGVVAAFLRGELALLYVSPERAAHAGFRRLLARVPVALFAIDEAHCLSQWGHDFRPEYLRLHELRELVSAPTIALTATATPRVMDEIVRALALRSPTVVRGDFRRPNLSFAVRHLRSDAERIEAAIAACDEVGLRSRGGSGRAILYCSTRKKTELVAEALKAAGFPVGHYHAGRTALARERAQAAFASGRTRILVATSAFGMGIDHPDVRLIIHMQSPGSLEAYYQEAGRAGRDGAPARCLLFFGAGDLMTQRRLQIGKGSGGAAELRVEDALAAIERYAGSARCRQQMLCAHFTGSEEHAVCGACDACVDPAAVREAPARAEAASAPPLGDAARQIILDAAGHLRRPVGKLNLARALRGSRAQGLSAGGLLQLPEHGALREESEAAIVATIDQLLRERKLERRGRRFPTVWLTGRPSRASAARSGEEGERPSRRREAAGGDLARELDRFRRRKARELKWKTYMVFQRRVIAAIERQRPASRSELERIPGLGAAKIERFGDELLAIVRRHGVGGVLGVGGVRAAD